MELNVVAILLAVFDAVNINVVAVVALAIFVLFMVKSKGRKASVTGKFRSLQYLNTKAEQNFFNQLQRSLPNDVYLMAKVRLADICVPKDPKNISDFNKVSRKHIDFVLVSRNNSEIVACIELDDRSHAKRSAKQRDRIKNDALKAAGIPLFRVTAARSYQEKLRQIEQFLADSRRSPQIPQQAAKYQTVDNVGDEQCPNCQTELNRVDMKWPNKGHHFFDCPGCSYRTEPISSQSASESPWYNPKEFRRR